MNRRAGALASRCQTCGFETDKESALPCDIATRRAMRRAVARRVSLKDTRVA